MMRLSSAESALQSGSKASSEQREELLFPSGLTLGNQDLTKNLEHTDLQTPPHMYEISFGGGEGRKKSF